ncbi:MAG TPA: Uma2 family endonuclease [Thermomicrobiaceae bacterium]|nr:Uma2 family endonuclease [Thermomicrobiaceae bacterium]
MSRASEATRLITAEELWALPEQPGVRYELAEGVLVEVPGAGAVHNLIAALVYRLMYAVAQGGNLGLVFTDGVGYILGRDPDIVRIPDVSFVARERIPEGGIPEGFWPGAPDLAVEIVSPNDLAQDVVDKVHEYLEAGTRMVWVLWPRRTLVMVYQQGGQLRELGPNDELSGGEVLPGLTARVASLFEVAQ